VPSRRGPAYVVLGRVGDDRWELLREFERKRGL